MHAITIPEPGPPEALVWAEVPDPRPGAGEVVVDVVAAGVNRADLLQRAGHYPPPPGAPEYPGMECSGRVAEVGEGVTGWPVGTEVCALLAGGGYAERVAVPAGQLLPVPEGVDLVAAAGLPEVACTVWSNVVMLARLSGGEVFLVHGGASGIGTMALQVAAALGARPYCTAGRPEGRARARELGALAAFDYRSEDFVARLGEETGGHGADVLLDHLGGPYLARNVAALATDGRMVCIGTMGGRTGELDLGALLTKRGAVHATGLRGRPAEGPSGKAAIVAAVRDGLWPLVASGRVRPVVDRTVPMERAAEAHRAMVEGGHIGKIILAR